MNSCSRQWQPNRPTRVHGLIVGAAATATLVVVGLALFLGTEVGAARKPIYDPDASGRLQLAQALDQAVAENKRVLVKWGGNWCSWCYKLYDFFHENEEVREILKASYVVVPIDNRNNEALMEAFDVEPTGYPYLSVFDANGKKLVDQATGVLETGSRHDPAKVLPFLKRWRPGPDSEANGTPAKRRLAAAQERAAAQAKNVLVIVGTESCGWCRRLATLLDDEWVAEILGKNYVVVDFDQDRTPGAAELRAGWAGNDGSSVPWYAVVGPDDALLATSEVNGKNTGYPLRDDEIEAFLRVVSETSNQLSDGDLTKLGEQVRRYAEAYSQ